jgi:hypothetical protein
MLSISIMAGCSSEPGNADGAPPDAIPDRSAADQTRADQTRADQRPAPDRALPADSGADRGAKDLALDLAPDRGATPDAPAPDQKPRPDTGAAPDGSGVTCRLTKETWYSGSTTCTKKSITFTGGKGQITVKLDQLPASELTGTCANHKASAALSGSTVTITFTAGGGACWTSCWDLEVVISGVPAGSYSVKVLSYSGSVSVS